MKYLPDTNVWIKILNGSNRKIIDRFSALNPSDIVFSSIVKAELYFGSYKSNKKAANLQLLEKLFTQFDSLPFNDTAAEIAGNIRAQLASLGTPIGPYDLQIAAIALVHNLVVVTHNTREFSRVVGLRIEDWEN